MSLLLQQLRNRCLGTSPPLSGGASQVCHFFCLCFYCLIWICFLFCVLYFDCRRVFIAWFSICYLFCCSSFFLVCRGKLGCKGNDDAKSCTTLNEGIFSLWADKQTFYPFFVWAFYLQSYKCAFFYLHLFVLLNVILIWFRFVEFLSDTWELDDVGRQIQPWCGLNLIWGQI